MSVPFPTRRTGPLAGHPQRASHCICEEGPRVFPGHDHCDRCGKYPKRTVAETWEQRAQHLATERAKQAAKRKAGQ